MQPEKHETALVYSTCPDQATAEQIGGYLVEHGLAACVNILPAMTSLYRWQGRVETAGEVVVLIKTRSSLVDDVFAAVKTRHPYDTPALLVLNVSDVERAFGAWIVAETSPRL